MNVRPLHDRVIVKRVEEKESGDQFGGFDENHHRIHLGGRIKEPGTGNRLYLPKGRPEKSRREKRTFPDYQGKPPEVPGRTQIFSGDGSGKEPDRSVYRSCLDPGRRRGAVC